MKIRVAEKNDLDSIVSIHLNSSKLGYKEFVNEKTLASRNESLYVDEWKELLKSDSQSTLVACVEDLVVGVGSVNRFQDGKSELTHLFFSPDYVGQGIGQKILEEIRKFFNDTMYLWVFKDNKIARRFYEANEFVLSGESRRFNYHGKSYIQVNYNIGLIAH